jgi:hypothetical protein
MGTGAGGGGALGAGGGGALGAGGGALGLGVDVGVAEGAGTVGVDVGVGVTVGLAVGEGVPAATGGRMVPSTGHNSHADVAIAATEMTRIIKNGRACIRKLTSFGKRGCQDQARAVGPPVVPGDRNRSGGRPTISWGRPCDYSVRVGTMQRIVGVVCVRASRKTPGFPIPRTGV